eukprot:scaffold111805_cov34-Prasinocladus_malaysianus.AAC.1
MRHVLMNKDIIKRQPELGSPAGSGGGLLIHRSCEPGGRRITSSSGRPSEYTGDCDPYIKILGFSWRHDINKHHVVFSTLLVQAFPLLTQHIKQIQ